MAVLLGSTLALVTVAAGCATGDGRELRPPDVPPPTTAPPGQFDGPVEFPTDDEFGDAFDGDLATLPDFAEFELFAAWRDGAPISERHACDGADLSPALTWTGVPDGTIELAITVVDEQTAGAVHWVVTGIDPAAVSTLEGEVPLGATERTNSFGVDGWSGPCPPEGSEHTYRFAIHALDQQLDGIDGESGSATAALVEGLALESASMTGTYSR